MKTQEQLELSRLLSTLCDGELTEADHLRLEELLADREARTFYLQYLDLHARLLAHPAVGGEQRLPALDAVAAIVSGEPHGPAEPEICLAPRTERPIARNKRRLRRLVSYGFVALATLAATLLVQMFVWRGQSAPPLAEQQQEPAEPPSYVATLAQAADVLWEGPGSPLREGSRLVTGELRLREGIARLHFDSDVNLVIEGPAALRLHSATSATLLAGKVVFRADDAAAPFTLSTPSSILVDTGTEYAVEVRPEREEVHVFAGEVQRLAKAAPPDASPQLLAAGEAWRYDAPATAPGEAAALAPEKFVRQLPPAGADPDPARALLAYEPFAYDNPNSLRLETAAGGIGWAGPWGGGFARPVGQRDDTAMPLNVAEGLTRANVVVTSPSGCFEHAGFSKYFRQLAEPVRLDREAVYYLSFLIRRGGPPTEPLNSVSVQFRQTDELLRDQRDGTTDMRRRLNFGLDRTNELFTHLERIGSRAPLPLSFGETYLLVAKVVASSEYPDQVFLRVYGPQEPVDRDEPGSWSAVGPPIYSDLAFDWLEIHINSEVRQALDEIRLGTTWSSVTAPWLDH
jgi:ferric-dicitrate binding protein FerR (iron transport regulator)